MLKNILLFTISCNVLLVLFFVNHSNMIWGDLLSYEKTAVNFRSYISEQTQKIDTVYPALATSYFVLIAENPLHLPFEVMWGIALLFFGCTTIILTIFLFEGRHIRWLLPSILCTSLLLGANSLFEGFDVLIMLLLFLMIASFETKSYIWTGFFLTMAIALKTSPIFLLPFVYLACRHHREKVVIGMIAGATCSFTVVMMTGGPYAFYEATVSHLAAMHLYGIDVMSSLSASDMLLNGIMGSKIPIWKIPTDPLPSWNANFSPITKTLLLLIIATLSTVLPLTIQRTTRENIDYFLPFVCAILFLVLTLSPVFTPHYLFWVLPLVIIWLCERYEKKDYSLQQLLPISLAVVVTGITTQWIFPSHWILLQDTQPLYASLIHNLRTVSLIVVTILLWRFPSLPDGLRSKVQKKNGTRKIVV